MPRDDDEYEDDDRPRRRRKFDEDDESRSRSRDEDDDEPPRRRSRDDDDFVPRPRRKSSLPLILGIGGAVLLFCCVGGGVGVWMFGEEITGSDSRKSANNQKQIGLAFHNYHDTMGQFPDNSYAPDGKPLLSWRVHILPYVEGDYLYRQFNLKEPWDSPTNLRLLAQMPRVYGTPAMQQRAGSGKTYYRGFSHQGAIFQKPQRAGFPNRLSMASITDGTSNTLLVVEAGDAVEWTKPDDLDFGPGRPLPPLGAGRGNSTVQVLMCDGSVRKISKNTAESNWRAFTTFAGGDIALFE